MSRPKRPYRLKHGLVVLGIAAAVLAGAAFVHRLTEPASVPRVGVLGIDSAMQAKRVEAFRAGLEAAGFVEGKNVVIDRKWAEGDFDRLPRLVSELVRDKADVIVAASPPAVRAVQAATKSVPGVFIVHNPVGSGFAQGLARPGGNLTGIAFQDTELSPKRLDYLAEIVPELRKVAILWHQAGGGVATVEAVEAAAKPRNVETRAFEVRAPADLPKAVAEAKAWGAQGLIQLPSPFITLNRTLLIDALAAHRMPATCELREYVVDGCLMTYSADINAMFRQMASFVARILKGGNPAEMPIEQPREFQFVINKKTADALGLAIPRSVELQMTEPFL